VELQGTSAELRGTSAKHGAVQNGNARRRPWRASSGPAGGFAGERAQARKREGGEGER
jgi:hypothetical protein